MKNITKFIMTLAIGATIFSCADTKSPNLENLISSEWSLDSVITDVVGFHMDVENPVTIMFSDSVAFSGNGSCNQYFGAYTTEEGTEGEDVISISVKGRSMAMCPNIEFEDNYIVALGQVAKFVATESQLDLCNANGEVMFTFVPSKI